MNHLIDGCDLAIRHHQNELRYYSSGSKYIPVSDESIGKWFHTNSINSLEIAKAHYMAGGSIFNRPTHG